MDPIRVLLADNQVLVRSGIRALLDALPGIEIVGESGDWPETIQMVEQHQPHVVLADITMPGQNGLEITRNLANAFPEVRFVILSVSSNEELIQLALHAGAKAYLSKGVTSEELELAIRKVVRGEIHLSPQNPTHTIRNHDGRTKAETDLLK